MNGIAIQVRILGLIAIGTICSLIACSGGNASPSLSSPVTTGGAGVTLTLEVAETNALDTVGVTAAVSGSSNTSVDWSVDNIPNGNATVGTISGSGTSVTYTAPATAGTRTITATSAGDTSKKASAPIAVKTPPMTISVTPATANVAVGTSLPISATVSGSRHNSVQWSVDGVANGNATVGTITGNGSSVTYGAPATPGTHTITAASAVNPGVNAKATISVQASAPTQVTLAPSTAAMNTGASLSFTATVTNATNTAVTWTVDGVANGNATTGTVTGSGNTVTYKAPATAGTRTISAISVANPQVNAKATISIQAPVVALVTVAPASATMNAGASLSFTASVSNATNTAVTWTVDGIANGNTTTGTLTGSGNTVAYKAPATAGTHTVKATSVQDPGQSFSASVVVASGAAVSLGPLAAFPGCEGMGCGASGGRGGDVYTVNTLEDTTNSGCVPQNGPNGPTCSLRDAMLKKGPRTIVFSVGGTITLKTAIYYAPPGMTIAGQTAPGGGIQIRGDGNYGNGGTMLHTTGNCIIRYLRIRPGNAPLNASDQGLSGLGIGGELGDDTVVDHNSFQWDSNKAVAWWSVNGLRRSTFSWNLVGECLEPHSTGMLVGGYNMGQTNMDQSSWDGHHNVLATIDHRLPQTNFKYGRWINNLTFGYSYAMLIRGGTQFDIIGNVFDGMNSGIKADRRHEVRWADTVANNENNILPGGTAQIFMKNNFGPHNPQGALDNFSTMLRRASSENGELIDTPPVETKFKATAQTIPASLNAWPITISTLNSINDLKAILAPTVGAYRRLACDGSWVSNRDAVDARVIGYIQNPATSPTSFVTTAGPYPSLSAGTRCADADGDGMPDVWEDAHGLNRNDPADRNIIRSNARGYTNLELYLSGLFPNGTPLP